MSTLAIDQSPDANDPAARPQLVLGEQTFGTITDGICSLVEGKTPKAWWVAFAISSTWVVVLLCMIAYLVLTGIGVWGNNIPNGWGFPIINFVFWIGIGHAGTLISAILYLFRQKWRTSINRFAEAMTIFAVICAGMFPAIHVGRIWFIYWVFPIPDQMDMWPNFRSPLLWDVFAVSTYATVSLMFWYMGMIPDLAAIRDRAKTKIRRIVYGIFSVGWRGSNRHWHRYEVAYLVLAALATPLVFSVHSVVSFDFAVAQLPGWHSTIFPPYFVVGAIFSGFAMVMMLLIPCRQWFGLKNFVTMYHLENMAKIILLTGSIVGLSYVIEFFTAWYSGNIYERFVAVNRALGPYAWAFWLMFFCNVIAPQFFWSKRLRTSIAALFTVSILVNVGMWFERFVIVITSLSRDFLPSSWGHYTPTWVDILTLIGSFGLFFTLFLLFLRFLPMMNMSEVKQVLHERSHGEGPIMSATYYEGEQEPLSEMLPEPLEPEHPDHTLEGIMLEFDDPDQLKSAADEVRKSGYEKWDCYTPFPVHGLDEAMGVKRTILPRVVFFGGLTGASLALGMQWFTNAFDFPFVISGKPLFSVPTDIPITFELTILLSAFTAFLGMLASNGLPRFWHPTFTSERFKKVTTDKFFLAVEAADPKFELKETQDFLRQLGAANGATNMELLES